MYDIIGYHNISYVRSSMTLLVIIIYYQGCMGTCTHTLGTHTHVPKYRYTYPKYRVLGGEHHR